MKKLFLFLCMAVTMTVMAQDSMKKFNINTDITLASRNIWRGVDYGSSPMIQGNVTLQHKYFEIGATGTNTLNGGKGFGNWMELYASAKFNDFTLTVDDYFFFNALDTLNNYFDWSADKTQHFIEARLKYDAKKFNIMVGYNFYHNKNLPANTTSGVYIEGEYYINDYISVFASYLTDASQLCFYDKGGMTSFGFTGKRKVFNLPLKSSIIFNPNYQNVSKLPAIGYNPVNFVIALAF